MIVSSMADVMQFTEKDDMVYTEERLRRALDVFRASEPYRKRRSLPCRNLGKLLESKCKQYETRSGKTSLAVRTTITGVWIDKDESGEYKPGNKRKAARTQKLTQIGPKRKRCDANGRDGNGARKRNKVSYTSGRQKGLSLEVTFKFKSDAAKAKVAELFPSRFSDVGLREDETMLSDIDSKAIEERRNLLARSDKDPYLPSSHAPSSPRQKVTPRAIEDNHKSFPCDDFTGSATRDRPSHNHLPIACISEPIIIDDSDDPITDIGRFHAELHRSAAQTKFIKTNWAHPIDYRCKPESCNFCQDYRYSMFGCGAVNIEVIQLEPGVYEEMGGGNREKGVPPTKICLTCSLERIAIAKCPGHEILPIEGQVEDEYDYKSFWAHITASSEAKHLTCSVCIKPAFYACAAQQKEDPCGLPVEGDDAIGCGLLLCGDCAGIVASCGLDMESLERHVGSTGKIFRADRDFLVPGSDLWQAWRK
jgi:hypothetical protein